jgi:hypothetical protein
MASPLSEAEQEQLQSLIARVPEGFLPLSMFLEIARLVVLPVIELVCFKYDEYRKKVLLLERAASDTLWPGQVHSPGSVVRPTDTGFKDAIARIIDDELSGLELSQPKYLKTVFNETKRGKEVALIYVAEVLSEPSIGEFYDFDKLPDNLMSSQTDFLNEAGNLI